MFRQNNEQHLSKQPKKFSSQSFIKSASHHSAPNINDSDTDIHDPVIALLLEIKNSETVKTTEFEAVTRLFTGQKIFVDTRDISDSPHLMLDGIREHGITKFFQSIARDDLVYLDIGANFGYNTLLIGQALRTGGSLHIFEANPDLIPLLEKTISVNGLSSKAIINWLAVTEKSGETVTLHRYKNLWGSSSLHTTEEMERYSRKKVDFDKEYKVKSIAVDDYVLQQKLDKVDLIKIDVEGVEDRVYDGMRETVKRPEVHVLLEYTFGAYADEASFFKKMKRDFTHMEFVSDQNGSSHPIESLQQLEEVAEYEWAMLHLYH